MKPSLKIFPLLLCASAFSQDANVIPFQGQLATQSGQPLSPTGPTTLVFRLYRQAVGGIAIWEESQPNLSVNAGRFSVLLGSREELPDPTNFNSTAYLGITVDDGNPSTTDVEMRPRQAIVPVINAAYARNADKLRGYDWSALFGANNPIDGKLNGSRIADESLTSAKIANAAIGTSEIADGAVLTAKIADGQVTNGKIAEGAIDYSKLAQELVKQLVPTGSIVAFAGDHNQVPDGWLLCDGRPIARDVYPRLYDFLGERWGVPASERRQIPDLRGVFLRGVDNSPVTGSSGRDPERANRMALQPGGAAGNAVGSFQLDEIKSHAHRFPLPWDGQPGNQDSQSIIGTANSDEVWITDSRQITEATGGSESRPKNVYVNYIIKY